MKRDLMEIMAGHGLAGKRDNSLPRRMRIENNADAHPVSPAVGEGKRVPAALTEFIRQRGRLLRPVE